MEKIDTKAIQRHLEVPINYEYQSVLKKSCEMYRSWLEKTASYIDYLESELERVKGDHAEELRVEREGFRKYLSNLFDHTRTGQISAVDGVYNKDDKISFRLPILECRSSTDGIFIKVCLPKPPEGM